MILNKLYHMKATIQKIQNVISILWNIYDEAFYEHI